MSAVHWSWGHQRFLVLAVNVEDDSLEILVPSLRSVPLSFQFLIRSSVFIHLRKERKAFSPVAFLYGKLEKSWRNEPEGHCCVCAETSRCRGFAQKHPGPSLLLLLLQAGQRHQALPKAALRIHPWCSTWGELQPWLS